MSETNSVETNQVKRIVRQPVIDVCCGTRMMWFDKKHPAVIYGDIRSEVITVTDRSHKPDGTRTLYIEPDTLMDFRDIPYRVLPFINNGRTKIYQHLSSFAIRQKNNDNYGLKL